MATPPVPPPAGRGASWGRLVLIGAGIGVFVWLLSILLRGGGWIWPVVVLYGLVVAVCGWLLYRDRRFVQALRRLDRARQEMGGWENMTDAQRAGWVADAQRVLDRL